MLVLITELMVSDFQLANHPSRSEVGPPSLSPHSPFESTMLIGLENGGPCYTHRNREGLPSYDLQLLATYPVEMLVLPNAATLFRPPVGGR